MTKLCHLVSLPALYFPHSSTTSAFHSSLNSKDTGSYAGWTPPTISIALRLDLIAPQLLAFLIHGPGTGRFGVKTPIPLL